VFAKVTLDPADQRNRNPAMFQRLHAFAALVPLVLVGPVAADAPRPPNVVLILADDLGWADLGCYGSKFHSTPHIDRLAADGLRFTDAYASCPVCSPTRAALMTGKYPARLHLTDWLPGRPDRPDQRLLHPAFRQELPLEEVTIARALKTAGYATGHVGKWHLGGDGFGPDKHGFDFTVGGNQAGSPLSYFAPFKNKDRFMPGLEKAPDGEYLTDRLTAEALGFIEKNKDRPFFLYLAHYAPHIPLKAKPELVAKYPKEMVLGKQSNAIYAAMLESIDEGVGRIVRTLNELKLTDNTMVIFTSDNGGLATLEGPNTPPTINTPLREGKGYLYEGGIRVPLVVKWPGNIKPGTVSNVATASHDLFPTILEICGKAHPHPTLPPRGEGKEGVDGVSIVPVLKGTGTIRREALFWHYPHYSNQGVQPGAAVREGDFKLIEFYETGRRELYDLKTDMSESKNLIEAKPEVAKRLAERLAQWRSDVGAQAMRPNPEYVPNPQGTDGTIKLPARTAEVKGIQLRYEPLPHKNTLGFWTRVEDTASWEFTVTKPGSFVVEVLQGCGKGQGGSEVQFVTAGQVLKMVVEDTGGFQTFEARDIGSITLDKAGRYTLTVKPQTKAKAAVMDLRQVVLKPKG
jgi:arylsulfatase A-like enzyme